MVQKCNYDHTMLSSVLIWLLFPTPVNSTLYSYNLSWCCQNLSSLLLKMSVVAADITISGKLFHTLTILGAKENFLKSQWYLLFTNFRLWPLVIPIYSQVNTVAYSLMSDRRWPLPSFSWFCFLANECVGNQTSRSSAGSCPYWPTFRLIVCRIHQSSIN